MKEKPLAAIKRLIPGYLWGPLIACLSVNLFAYYMPRLIHVMTGAQYRDLSIGLDAEIPLAPGFIVVYIAAYVSWYLGYALICRERVENCEVIFGDIIAKAICMLFFILLPTSLERPEPTGSGPFVWLLKAIYAADTPADNLFPSIHCLESWIVWRGMLRCRQLENSVKIGFLLMALLVFASTLLVKQHVLVDLPAAVIVGEVGLFVGKKLRLGARYAAFCRRKGVLA